MGAPVRNIEHDHDTPGNSPLLTTDKAATHVGTSNLGDVNWDLSRADSNRETIDETAHNKHGDVLRYANREGTRTPDESSNLDAVLTTHSVRNKTRKESTTEGPARHGGGYSTLHIRGNIRPEVVVVLICANTFKLLSATALAFEKRKKKGIIYREKTNIADIDEISKPNKAPPITAIAYMN